MTAEAGLAVAAALAGSTFNLRGWLASVLPSTATCITGIVMSPGWVATKV